MKQWHSATASRMKLRSVSLIEFLDDNPEPVRNWKIARQTERRRACIPGARLRTVPLIAAVAPRRQPRGVTCPVADRGGKEAAPNR
jgi:hypothetical protein